MFQAHRSGKMVVSSTVMGGRTGAALGGKMFSIFGRSSLKCLREHPGDRRAAAGLKLKAEVRARGIRKSSMDRW